MKRCLSVMSSTSAMNLDRTIDCWLQRYSNAAYTYAWNWESRSSRNDRWVAMFDFLDCLRIVLDSEVDWKATVCCLLAWLSKTRSSHFSSSVPHCWENPDGYRCDLKHRLFRLWMKKIESDLLVFWLCSACPDGTHFPELNFQWLTSTNTISTYMLYVASGFNP